MRITNLFTHATMVLCALGLHLACGGSNPPRPASSPSATNSGQPSTNSTTSSNQPPSDPVQVQLHARLKQDVATGDTLTEFQKTRLLGHYSTGDGASGFILDRTVTPWRAKLDGVKKVVTLKESNTPRRGEKEYTSDDRSIWIRVDTESGSLLLFQGPKQHEGVRIDRDADAEQLK